MFNFFLQDLPSNIANYLNYNVDDSLLICGDYGQNQNIDILKKFNNNQTIQLGPMWNKFCRRNRFYPGCYIRFKFPINNYYICNVYII